MAVIHLKPKPKINKKIGVIVSARMTSKRFPGKSMALLQGKPVIQWVLERAQKIRADKGSIPMVVLAVPDTDDSEPMLELAHNMGVENFCGDEEDVLKRYYDTARFFNFDVIVRITGDCPFLDPKVSSEVLQLLIWRKLDYSSNVYPARTHPKGLDTEAFTMDCLEAAHILGVSKREREHVTIWMQNNNDVKKGNVVQQKNNSHINWCVDLPEDIARLEKIIGIKEGANENDQAN